MTIGSDRQPAIALVDDDFHSARLMMRMLAAHGGPHVEWLRDPDTALETLAGYDALPPITGKCMALVDLKASSTATRDFIIALRRKAPGLLVVAMAPYARP